MDFYVNDYVAKQKFIIKSAAAFYYHKVHKHKRSRRFWVCPTLEANRRLEQGVGDNLLRELKLTNPCKFRNYFRMDDHQFDYLLSLIQPIIDRLVVVREPISSRTRLAMVLRYLASGDSMVSVAYNFRVGKSTTSHIIRETCTALWDKLSPNVFMNPNEETWMNISKQFESKWHFPHCIGALDGKHVIIQAPANSGSQFYNYKGTHSIILMAMCSADYEFTIVDIGAQGRQSDGGVFKSSEMGKRFDDNSLNVPQPTEVFPGGPVLPYVLVADNAFQLSEYLMKPYPGTQSEYSKQVFNYRLSRARRTIENTFGILAARWRIFRKPIIASLETTEAIVKACVCLHNYLMQDENGKNDKDKTYCPRGFVDIEIGEGDMIPGHWRGVADIGAFQNARIRNQNTYSTSACCTRDTFREYFMTDGCEEFQWERALQ